MMTVRNQIEAVLAKPAIVQPVSRLLLKQLLAEHDARVKVLRSALSDMLEDGDATDRKKALEALNQTQED